MKVQTDNGTVGYVYSKYVSNSRIAPSNYKTVSTTTAPKATPAAARSRGSGDGSKSVTPQERTSSKQVTDKHHSTVCVRGAVYWKDSNDVIGDIAQQCPRNSLCFDGGCICEPGYEMKDGSCQAECNSSGTRQCSGNKVILVNSCNNTTQVIQQCESDQVCDNGQCKEDCKPQKYKRCYRGNVYWFDSCDNPGQIAYECVPNTDCINSECICQQGYEKDGNWCVQKKIWECTLDKADGSSRHICRGCGETRDDARSAAAAACARTNNPNCNSWAYDSSHTRCNETTSCNASLSCSKY